MYSVERTCCVARAHLGLMLPNTATHCNTLQHTATHCNTLHHTATHCNTLQHTATHCNTVQRRAARLEQICDPHCKTLQHTAPTFCAAQAHLRLTLQHTATHCNTLNRHVVARLEHTSESETRSPWRSDNTHGRRMACDRAPLQSAARS